MRGNRGIILRIHNLPGEKLDSSQVPYFFRKIVRIERLPVRAAILVSYVRSTEGQGGHSQTVPLPLIIFDAHCIQEGHP